MASTEEFDADGVTDVPFKSDSDATLRFKARQIEREDVQKKTFTKWINSHLCAHHLAPVNDLYEDFRDGTQLLTLLQILTGIALKPEIGRMRVHHLNNVSQVIQLLDLQYNIKLVNISSDDIVDGNQKLTLALIWNIIQHWQMENVLKTSSGKAPRTDLEKSLLEWCQVATQGYKNVTITNFTSSWRDGLAFNALLHRYHPELFDYEKLIGADYNSNLRHAFSIGHDKLGIMQLLDPEDVNVDMPDKKSIMMYVTCCYEVLHKSDGSFCDQVPLTSLVNNGSLSMNAASFQDALESILTWLLEAHDILAKQEPISDNVQIVKEQFQEHEEFMVRLTVEQGHIGQVLQAGSQLLVDGSTTESEAQQIEAQMSLLNRHWEELRIQAMDRQTRLQQVLTALQQQQLDRLSDWLKKMETHLLSDYQDRVGGSHASIQQQLEKHKLLQEEVEREQEQVNSLQNMVVVVDESNSDEAYTALERQLESLGQRWGVVCHAVEERAAALQSALDRWKNFDNLHVQFSDWLTRAEQVIAKMPVVNSTSDMLLIVELVRQLKLTERELDDWIPRFDDLEVYRKELTTENLVADQALVKDLDDKLQRLHDRWDNLVQVMERKSSEVMSSGVELKEVQGENGSQVITICKKNETKVVTETITVSNVTTFASKRIRIETESQPVTLAVQGHDDLLKELQALQQRVMSCNNNDAIRVSGDISDINRQLDVCKARFKELHSLETDIQKMNARVQDETSAEFVKQLNILNQRYAETCKKTGERHLTLTEALKSSPPAAYMEALDGFVMWMTEAEQLLAAEKFFVDEQDVMEHQLSQYLELQTDVQSHQKNYDYLSQNGQALMQSVTNSADAEKLRSGFECLKRWKGLVEAVDKRVALCQSTLEQLKQYNTQVAAVRQWISDVEGFLRPVTQPVDSLEALRFELRESQAVERDVKSMRDNIASITSNSKVLMEAAGSGVLHEKLRIEVLQLTTQFDDIARRSLLNNTRLTTSVQRIEKILHDIHQLDVWVDGVIAKNIKPDFVNGSPETLNQLAVDFKKLKEEMSEKEIIHEHISKEAASLASDEILRELEDVTKLQVPLDDKWKQLVSLMLECEPKMQVFIENYATFTGLLREELQWLDQLSKKLSAGLRPSGDAEELSEELDELENVIHSQKMSNKEQLSSAAKLLIDNNILSASVSTQLASYQRQNDELVAQGKQVMVQLEENIIQAQSREGRILDMSQWMTEMNGLLQSRLDADILAGDVPKEYETLKMEFAQHENLLKELEAEVTLFRKQKKIDAAIRLEEQISLLKKHFVEVTAKFLKFQRPADFDTKLTHVKRLLDDVDRSLHLVELVSSDPETVQNKLDQCIKLYKTMSEIKPDVEYVIKTGRQVVDKKQVDFPGVLTSQIDAVKQQFNDLGSQVTRGKVTLEKAVKLSKGFQKEMSSLEDLHTSLYTELIRRENVKAKDIDGEIKWLKSSQQEISQKLGVIPTLNEVLSQFAKLSDDNTVYESEQELRRVGDQLRELSERMASRCEQLEHLSKDLDNQYVEFETKQREVTVWMDATEQQLNNCSSSHDIQQFMAERNQLVSSVDEVRDLAIELINKSSKYSEMIEMKLTTFNQRWQDIEQKIQAADQPLQAADEPVIIETCVESKAVRAEAALTQLLAEDVCDIDNSMTSSSIVTSIEQFQSNLPSVENFRSDAEIHQKLTEVENEEQRLRCAIERLIELDKPSTVDEKSSTQVNELQAKWNMAQAECEKTKCLYISSLPEFQLWQKKAHDIELRMKDAESELGQVGNDSARLLLIQTELEVCQHELEQLKQQNALVTSPTSQQMTSTTLANLDQLMSTLQLRVVHMRSVAPPRSLMVVDSPDGLTTSLEITTPTESTTSSLVTATTAVLVTSAVTSTFSSQTVVAEDNVEVASANIPSTEAEPKEAPMPNLDSFAAKLNNFALVLSEKAKSQPVTIGNLEEIEAAIKMRKTILNDLTSMKVQIDAIVTKSEALIVDSTSEHYNKQLINNVNKLCQCWRTAIDTVASRQNTLELMLDSCRQLNEVFADTTRWIEQTALKYSTAEIGNDVPTIKQQIDIVESERLELTGSRQRVDVVIASAEKLISDNPFDKATKLNDDIANINQQWQQLMTRVTEREKSLQNAINAMYRFDSDMKSCQLWLTKVEVVLNHHSDAANEPTIDQDKLNHIRESLRDLQLEMESQRIILESLNHIGRQMASGQQSESLTAQLQDMNERFSKLTVKAASISQRLGATDATGSEEDVLTSLVDLTQWLTDKANELNRQKPVGGDLQTVGEQLEAHQVFQKELADKRPTVEQNLAKGQSLLRDSGIEPVCVADIETCSADVKIGHFVRTLGDSWTDVNSKSQDWQNVLDETSEKLMQLQDSLDDLNQHLVVLEKEVAKWKPVGDLLVDDLQRQIDATLLFQQKVAPTQSEVDQCNDLANQFTEIVLSHKNVIRLEDSNRRWSTLHTVVEDRLQQLQNALRDFGPQSQQLLSASVTRPWERAVANNKVPYYINHKNETTQWDHPEMTSLVHALADYNTVRFSAYRTSMKLRLLQKTLHLDLLELNKLEKAFATVKEHGDSGLIDVTDVINCLVSLYEPLANPQSQTINIPLTVDLVLNWLLNVYDSGRSGQIRALSLKTALLLMCNAHYDEKYRFLFRLVADSNGRVDHQRLTALLRDCIQIPKQLGEVAAFGGSNVEPSVQSCLEKAGRQDIDAANFMDWMKLEPQSMVWIPVMHRVGAAENSRHQAKCAVCRKTPIIGLRYRCLKCFSFDMCQKCFFSGQTAKSHKLTHPMQEYCGMTTSSEDMRDWTKVMKNKFRSKQYFKKHPRLGYLPVQTVMDSGTLERSVSEASSVQEPVSPSTQSASSTPKERRNVVVAATHSTPPSLNSTANSSATLELHSRVGMQAQRLADVEQKTPQKQPASTVDVDDEHRLIAQYCQNLNGHKGDKLKSPLQIMVGVDAEQQAEIEATIRELEAENRNLQAEYDQLLLTHRDPSVHPDPKQQPLGDGSAVIGSAAADERDVALLAEAKQLTKHKTQLEIRMRILEDHNRQLEAQLQRLHLLLDQPETDGAHVITYSASDRATPGLSSASSHSSLPRRDPPSFMAYQQSMREKTSSAQNGSFLATTTSEQRLLSEEEELERMMKELQETLPPSEGGANNVDNLFHTVGQVSRAVGTLVNIMTDEESNAVAASPVSRSVYP